MPVGENLLELPELLNLTLLLKKLLISSSRMIILMH